MLVGMMAVGKSTVARAVAAATGLPGRDSDEVIEAREGRSVGAIDAAEGTAAMRAVEADFLRDALAAGGVVAAPGGVVTDPALRRLLRSGPLVVWLRAGAGTVLAGLGPDDHRPDLFGADRPAGVARMVAARGPLYAAVADHVVDVDRTGGGRRAVDAVVADVLAARDTGRRSGPPAVARPA